MLAVVAVLAVVVSLVVRHGSGPAPQTPAAGARTQSTALLSLRAGDGHAAASVLLADDARSHRGTEVLIPDRVIADVPGYGSHPFGQALTLPGAGTLARATLSDLMGITVDAHWTLDQQAFTTLVDRLGGVEADVDVDVVRRNSAGGGKVLIAAGQQRLSGAQAWAFATYLAPGEDPTAQLPRVQSVLDGVLAQLPKKPAEVGTVLRALPGGMQSDWAPQRLATMLVALASDAAASNITYTQLPVLPIDTGGSQQTYRIDPAKVHDLVTSSLAGSVAPGASGNGNRVLVENAVGTPGLGTSVRDRLVKSGYRFVDSRNLRPFGRPKSVVLIFDNNPRAEAKGAALARSLGLPATAVLYSPQAQSVADMVVILGLDYRP